MPEYKMSVCPWCNRETKCYFVTGIASDGRPWCDWVCIECQQAASEMRDLLVEQEIDK